MDCLQARESISARLDGESGDVPETLVDGHVQRCQACQGWQEAVYDVTRRARMTGWSLPDDLPDFAQLVGAATRRRSAWLPRLRTGLLAAAALGQLVLAAMLLSGAADEMGMHADHELGIFDITLAVAFGVGAIRPALAAGLAWAAGAAAAGLLATAVTDIIDDATVEVHELKHLIAVAGAQLLWWTARDERRFGPVGARRVSAPSAAAEPDPVRALRSTAA